MLNLLYSNLFVMAIVAGAIYIFLKVLNKLSMKIFKASWHYYTNIVIYSLLLLPYHKVISLLSLGFDNNIESHFSRISTSISLRIPEISALDIKSIENSDKIYLNFIPYFLIIGTIIFLVTMIIQKYRFHQQILNVCKISDETQTINTFLKCKEKMSISKDILIYVSPYIGTPFLYGILKPHIILPETAFTDEELECIFYHELTHLKRHDPLIKFLLLIINSVHWYNPLVYMARRDIDQFCELSCDENISEKMSCEEKRNYCELILSVLKTTVGHKMEAYSAFSDKKQLIRRVNIIMGDTNKKNRKFVKILSTIMTISLISLGTIITYASSGSSYEEVAITNIDSLFSKDVQEISLENENVAILESTSVSFNGTSNIIAPMASGDLGSGKSYSYDKQYLAKGNTVTINAEWAPSESDIAIGLKSSSGKITAKTVSGGDGSVTYEIKTSGYYYIYVGNISKSGVKFDVSYISN